MNDFILRILVVYFVVIPIAHSGCDTVSFEETIQIEKFEYFHSRTAVRSEECRAILISDSEGVETFGVSGKAGLIGPIRLNGLLREIESPLDYSPFSDLMNEDSRFTLDGSLSNNYRKFGVYLNVIPGLFSVYTYGNGSKLPGSRINRFGFVLNWSSIIQLSDYFKGEILYCYNVLDGKTNNLGNTEWYPLLPLISGADISHLAFLFDSFGNSDGNSEKGCLDYRFMFSLSGSKTIPQGFLSHLFVGYSGTMAEAGFFGGIKNIYYVNSKGDQSDNASKLAFSFIFKPVKLFALETQYTRISSFSGFPLDNYLGGKEDLFIDFKFKLIKALDLSFMLKKSFEYGTDGNITEKNDFRGFVGYSGRYVDISTSLKEPITEIIFVFDFHVKPGVTLFRDIEFRGKAETSFKNKKRVVDASLNFSIDKNPGIKITAGLSDWQFEDVFKSKVKRHAYLTICIRSKTDS